MAQNSVGNSLCPGKLCPKILEVASKKLKRVKVYWKILLWRVSLVRAFALSERSEPSMRIPNASIHSCVHVSGRVRQDVRNYADNGGKINCRDVFFDFLGTKTLILNGLFCIEFCAPIMGWKMGLYKKFANDSSPLGKVSILLETVVSCPSG